MFNIFKKKPAAIINVSRRTGEEESCQVSVNAYELTREAIFNAITEAGEAMKQRMVENNKFVIAANEKAKAIEEELKTKNMIPFKK